MKLHKKQETFQIDSKRVYIYIRDVTQFGSVSALGAESRRFKSCHLDFYPYNIKYIMSFIPPREFESLLLP